MKVWPIMQTFLKSELIAEVKQRPTTLYVDVNSTDC